MRFKDAIAKGLSPTHQLKTGVGALLTLFMILALSPVGFGQDASIYGMNGYPPGYAPTAPNVSPGYTPTVAPGIQPTVPTYTPDFIPVFTPDFWKGKSLAQGLQAGTVLTGVLQDKLSSKSSKVGDVFAIALPDGYVEAGNEVLPRGTKIVGSVTQVISGQQSHNGQPGRIDIALQTLVLPDGRSTPVYALIERNPNLEFQKDPTTPPKKNSLPVSSYAQSVRSSAAALVNSVTRRATGLALYYPGRTGAEFLMEPGQMLPLRLNRPVDLAALMRQPIPDTTPGAVPGTASVPGLVETGPPKAPAFRPETVPNEDPNLDTGNSNQPGSNIPDPF